MRFVFISGCFLAEIKDIDFYILVTVVVIVLGEVDTKTFLVVFGLNGFEMFAQSFCELSFSLAYIDLVARGAL